MSIRSDFPEDRFVVYEKLAKEHFGFLEREYSFTLSRIDRKERVYTCLRYRSERVYVNLYYSVPGFELDFSFGRIGIDDAKGNYSFESHHLLYVDTCPAWSSYSGFSATSYTNLCKCLPKLASFLEECGAACLRGEAQAYVKMYVRRRESAARSRRGEQISQIREAAAMAWRNRDYARFVELYGEFEGELTVTERKKLAYCRKRV